MILGLFNQDDLSNPFISESHISKIDEPDKTSMENTFDRIKESKVLEKK